MKQPKNPKRKLQKYKREIRKKFLGIENSENALMRTYTEATKTRRAIKSELFGNNSKQIDTSIELFVKEILEENGYDYIFQKAIRWCNYDFYLPNQNVALEIEGEYWHCDPRVYPNGPKNSIQCKNLEKNKMKQEICKSQNIPLIRVHEHDIKKDKERTKQQILECIQHLSGSGFCIKETNYKIEKLC